MRPRPAPRRTPVRLRTTVHREDLPPEILTRPAAWAACVAGALAEDDVVRKLARAGFQDIQIVHRHPLSLDVRALYPLFDADTVALMRRLVPALRQDAVAVAVVVRARKAA